MQKLLPLLSSLIILLVLIVGCAPTHETLWTKNNLTQIDFERDKSGCSYQATIAANAYQPTTPRTNTNQGTSQIGSVGINLLANVPNVVNQSFAKEAYRNNLFTLCMNSLGYRLESFPIE